MTPEKRTYKRDVIIEVTTNLMFPLTLLFGLYVMFGTGGTGGGFQGGTILATAFILYITVFGHEKGREKMPESVNALFKSLGLFLYNGAGWICVLFSLATAQWLNMPAFWPVTDLRGSCRLTVISGWIHGIGGHRIDSDGRLRLAVF